MPINVEINETQAQSNEVKVGQFRTDGNGSYGFVTLDNNDLINFVIVVDDMLENFELPTLNYAYRDACEDIAEEFPYVVNGKILIEGCHV